MKLTAMVKSAALLLLLGGGAFASMGYRTSNYAMQEQGLAHENGQENSGEASSVGARNYYAPLTDREKADIRYIILTISGKSKLSLLFAQSSLNQAGNRVADVHPLVFLGYIFSDQQLKYAAKRIDGMVWDRFSGDMADSLAKEAERRNVKKEYLEDFSKKIGVEESIFNYSVQNGRWKEFINLARNNTR